MAGVSTPQQSSGVEVTQADREAAADFFTQTGGPDILAHMAREGHFDHKPEVQCLSRHRIATQTDRSCAEQLRNSGLITKERFNHICANIRARETVTGEA